MVLKFEFESIYKMYSFVCFETIHMANLLGMLLQFLRPNINLDLSKLLLKMYMAFGKVSKKISKILLS